MAVSGLWSWTCYPEAIGRQVEDGSERIGHGADGEADDGYGGEEQVAN